MDIYDTNGGPANSLTYATKRLNTTLAMAKKHGRAMSIPEWGLGSNGDRPEFVQLIYNWVNTEPAKAGVPFVYHSYFNGKESKSNTWYSYLGQYPKARAEFIRLFSGVSGPPSTTTWPTADADTLVDPDSWGGPEWQAARFCEIKGHGYSSDSFSVNTAAASITGFCLVSARGGSQKPIASCTGKPFRYVDCSGTDNRFCFGAFNDGGCDHWDMW